jgi:small subunit ribosomal protein S17
MSVHVEPPSVAKPSRRKEQVGKVISARMEKTVVVLVERHVPHPRYKKMVTKRKKFYAHNEGNRAKEGDWVKIRETRPLSRLKRWEVVEILKQGAPLAEGELP